MTGHFPRAVEVVLRHEGGLADHAEDPGGVTNWGISVRWAVRTMIEAGDRALELLDVDGDGDVDADDIRAMPRETAIECYRTWFWQPNRYDDLVDERIATKVFDCCVNMGSRQAHRIAQRAVRAAGGDLVDDGILGPISRSALNLHAGLELLAALRAEQAGFYRALVVRNDALRRHGIDVEDFRAFERGWLRRAYS